MKDQEIEEDEEARFRKALSESERRYRNLFETLPDGFASVGMDRKFLKVNAAFCAMLGYTQEELYGLSYADVTPEKWHAYEEAVLEEQIWKRGYTDVFEKEYIRKDGHVFPAEVRVHVVRDEKGIPLEAWAFVRNITERKRVERALQESEEKFRLLFEKSVEPVVLIDGDMYIDCNEAALKLMGCDAKEQMIGLRPSDTSPERQPDGRSSSEKAAENDALTFAQGHNQFDWMRRTFLGEEFWVEVCQTLIPIQGKQVMYTVWRDIRERKKAEAQLRESEERYRMAIEHSNDGVLIIRHGIRLFANRKYLEIFGYSRPEEVVGKSVLLVIHPDDWERVAEYSRMRERGESAPTRYEFKGVRKDGSIICVEASVARITYLGEPASLSFVRDVTERRYSEEALRDSEGRYRTVVDLSPSGIFIHVNGRVEFANQSFVRMVGATRPEQLYGRNFQIFVHPDYSQAVAERLKMITIDRQQSPLAEQKLVRLDGSVLDIEVTAFPFNYKGSDGVMAVIDDITQRKQAEEALKKREQELENKSINLEEANTALKVLLRHRDDDRKVLEQAILDNVKELVLPYLQKLRAGHLTNNQETFVDIAESNLQHIISPFIQKMSSAYSHFTPTEIQVADLIKSGKSSKEIAELLNVSRGTVDTHRNNIRNKLGLRNEKINLQAHLQAL